MNQQLQLYGKAPGAPPETTAPWRQALDKIQLAHLAMNRGDLTAAAGYLDEACRHDDRTIPALAEMIDYARERSRRLADDTLHQESSQ